MIYHAANRVLKSTTRGDDWEFISPDLTTNDKSKLTVDGKGGDGNIQYCTISTLAESPIVPGLLWVGTDDGNVWVTKDGGKNWTKLNDNIKGNPGYWVSRVEASHHFPGTAYVTYTGLRNDDFRAFVYKTTDYGQTWTSIAGNLPAKSINVDPRGSEEPEPAVRRRRVRPLRLGRRRQDVERHAREHAHAAGVGPADPPARRRAHRRHARPRRSSSPTSRRSSS